MSKMKAMLTICIGAIMVFAGIALSYHIVTHCGQPTSGISNLSQVVMAVLLIVSGVYLGSSISDTDEDA